MPSSIMRALGAQRENSATPWPRLARRRAGRRCPRGESCSGAVRVIGLLPQGDGRRAYALLQITQTVMVLSFQLNHGSLQVPLRVGPSRSRRDEGQKRATVRKQTFRIAALKTDG